MFDNDELYGNRNPRSYRNSFTSCLSENRYNNKIHTMRRYVEYAIVQDNLFHLLHKYIALLTHNNK